MWIPAGKVHTFLQGIHSSQIKAVFTALIFLYLRKNLSSLKKILLFSFFIFSILACNKKQHSRKFVTDASYDKANSFLNKDSDSAYYYFNKVTGNSKDSLEIAISYNQMATIQADAGDYFGAQEALMISLKFLNDKKEKNFECLSSNYNELGLNSLNLKRYNLAISYYDKVRKYDVKKAYNLRILNNKGLIYQKEKKYIQSLNMYSKIILENTADNQMEYAKVMSNIARTKWLQNPEYNAAPYLLKSLHIREKENDAWGQNASYSHLADYYMHKNPDSALIFAKNMYQVAKKIKSPDDQIEALQKLIVLSPSQQTKQYFETYRKLDDSLQTARNAAKNQFALVRYEAEKNKSDNLNLQKDNTEKKYQIIKQKIWLFSTFLLVLAAAVFSIIWYKKREQRLELEAQNTIKENQLKTSKKVHDVVANGLYRVMAEIENHTSLDRESILDKLENMYEKSRDISYEELSFTDQDFHEKIAELLKSFATQTTKVLYMGNTPELWENISTQVKCEIEQVLQELMVNMDKHSQASQVVVRFIQKNHYINISYTDNGIGISEGKKFNNGLTNTGNRIKSIHGEITFESNGEKGLKVQISFPVS